MILTETPTGHGNTLPPWANPNHPEVRRGTRLIAEADPRLIVCHVPELPGIRPRVEAFVLFGPSQTHRGLVPVSVLRDNAGNPYYPPLPWERIVRKIREMYRRHEQGKSILDEVDAHNRKLSEMQERERDVLWLEAIQYTHRQLQRDLNGEVSRHSARSVLDGYWAAREGRKPEPVGLKVHAPAKGPLRSAVDVALARFKKEAKPDV